MHVGMGVAFQNPENALSDAEVWDEELAMALEAEALGFDSLWAVEHHFDDYTMCPDPVQFLTYVAARTSRIQLGTGVIVLPWHDPMRVAEHVTLLDNLSGGRMILGIGRGLARIEYEGFGVDMNTSRERFVEMAECVLTGLANGYVEYDGELVSQVRREIRPAPRHSFAGRTYAAAVSPESMPIMARLGIGLLVIPQKPWAVVEEDFRVYNEVFREVNGTEPPAPLSGGFCFVDESADRAEEMAYRYIGGYYGTVLKHYEFDKAPHAGVTGYEFYTHITKYIERHGQAGAAEDFVKLMPYGTPAQVLEKIEVIKDKIGMAGFFPTFAYAGMNYTEGRRNMNLFADKVMPELKTWDAPPVGLTQARAS
jgi:alkanesulfonate monooxygenase SsuD/methylene tetrahydromethanopterin reductase-like flavin-dependent oxidoreductase (luciferase family)